MIDCPQEMLWGKAPSFLIELETLGERWLNETGESR